MEKITNKDFIIHISEIPTEHKPKKEYRYNGGEANIIVGIDLDYMDENSLEREFVPGSVYGRYFISEGLLYLDCDIQGDRGEEIAYYRLFTLKKGKIQLITEITDENENWAVRLWPYIEEFLKIKI